MHVELIAGHVVVCSTISGDNSSKVPILVNNFFIFQALNLSHFLDSFYKPGPYFIKVKIFLTSGFKKNWSSLSLGEFFKFQFLLTLMLILFTI